MNGVDYCFRLREELEAIIEAGEMLEYAEYVDNYYGTPLAYISQTLDEGKDVFLEIEVQGTKQAKGGMSDGVSIPLTPPGLAESKSRVIGRGVDEMSVIEGRMAAAREGIETMVLYDYAIVNDEVPLAM